MPPRVVVIGGGPAGCAGAHALARRGCEVVLLEADDGLGGRTRTLHRDGFAVDTGAVFLLGSYRRTLRLLRELGRRDHLVSMRAPSAFDDGRKLHVFKPLSPISWARLPLLGWRDKARLGLRGAAAALHGPDLYDGSSLYRAERGLALESWARDKVGSNAYEFAVRAQIEPIWGLAGELPSHTLWPALARVGARVPPWRASASALRGGIGALCGWLADAARAAGPSAQVRTGVRVRSLDARARGVTAITGSGEAVEADAALVATDAHAAATLLDGCDPAGVTRSALEAVRYSGSVHVAVGYDRDPWPRFRPWAVVPVGPGPRAVLGLSLLARKCPASVPRGAQVVDVYLGDHGFRELEADAAAACAQAAIANHLGPPETEPAFVWTFARRRAFPVPRRGAYAMVARAGSALPPRVRLAGDYVAPGGIETAVREGERAAEELAAGLAA